MKFLTRKSELLSLQEEEYRVVCLLLQHLKVAVCELGKHDGGDALHLHHYAFLALVLHFYKDALYTIEGAANDAHAGTLGEVYLLGREVDQAVIVALTHSDELLHLSLGDDDGHSATVDIAGEVLQVVESSFQFLYALACGVGKEQVVDGRDELPCLVVASVGDDGPPHGDEALYILAFEILLCLKFASESGAHGKPGEFAAIGNGYGCILKGGHFSIGDIPLAPRNESISFCFK